MLGVVAPAIICPGCESESLHAMGSHECSFAANGSVRPLAQVTPEAVAAAKKAARGATLDQDVAAAVRQVAFAQEEVNRRASSLVRDHLRGRFVDPADLAMFAQTLSDLATKVQRAADQVVR